MSAFREAVTGWAAGGPGDVAQEPAFARAHDEDPARPKLSPKERQVLLECASGLTLQATARRTGVGAHTARYS
ncbi:hypothetical protein ACIF9R_13935 [Streptomyces sp. NPDC086080]|uniref:hypothetical protein n=1 Tax=Streptomyces sp. NPDC086080 TaxID=3365748 RepID=UPI0037CEDCBB